MNDFVLDKYQYRIGQKELLRMRDLERVHAEERQPACRPFYDHDLSVCRCAMPWEEPTQIDDGDGYRTQTGFLEWLRGAWKRVIDGEMERIRRRAFKPWP